MKNRNLYTLEAVNNLLVKLEEHGYGIQCYEGVLLDNYVCYAPDDSYYHFIIEETPLNSNSSAYSVRRCSKISKATQKWIESFETE